MTTATLPVETGLFVFPREDRDCIIVARRYGMDGNGGATLKRIGDEFGLTRERVRQIVSETDPRTYFKPGAQSALKRIITRIASSLPACAATLENTLRSEGLTPGVFRLEGVIELAALLGYPEPFRVRYLNGTRFAVAPDCPSFQEIVIRARKLVRRYGMATAAQCLHRRYDAESAQRELVVVEGVLSAQSHVRWLTPGSGWFWFSNAARNRIGSRIKKMLAVANPLEIGELRAGLAKAGHPLAPNEILLDLCRQLPGVSVHGDRVTADAALRSDKVLNKTEREILRLLSEHNGCMSNSELINRAFARGIKRPTFFQCVTQSPIVSRYKGGYYRLIGSRSLVEAFTSGDRLREPLPHKAPARPWHASRPGCGVLP